MQVVPGALVAGATDASSESHKPRSGLKTPVLEMGRNRPAKFGIFKIGNKNVGTQNKKVCAG